MQTLSGPALNQIAAAVGARPEQAQTAIAAALPALLGALDQNTNDPTGAQRLAAALDRDHDGSLLGNIPGLIAGMLGGGAQAAPAGKGPSGKALDGAGILGHILGAQRGDVEQGVARASGLNTQQVAKLLPLLAPLVMAALARQKKQGGLSADALSQMLGREAGHARQATPPSLLETLAGALAGSQQGRRPGGSLMEQAGRAALGHILGGGRKS
ncbi:MAG: DUF937 domain-containing protein [Rubricoccaceae bacterium]